MTATLMPYEQAVESDPVSASRSTSSAHRDQDVLRLPDEVRRRAQHQVTRCASACPARCRSSTARRWSPPSASAWR